MFSVIIGAVILLLYVPIWLVLQHKNAQDDNKCFVCKRSVEEYNTFVTKKKNLDEEETEDVMEEMDSLPVLQVGNAFVTLCPICNELTFGFSSDPEEKSTGVKLNLSIDTKYDFDARED